MKKNSFGPRKRRNIDTKVSIFVSIFVSKVSEVSKLSIFVSINIDTNIGTNT